MPRFPKIPFTWLVVLYILHFYKWPYTCPGVYFFLFFYPLNENVILLKSDKILSNQYWKIRLSPLRRNTIKLRIKLQNLSVKAVIVGARRISKRIGGAGRDKIQQCGRPSALARANKARGEISIADSSTLVCGSQHLTRLFINTSDLH